jgi:monooxygenase
MDHFDVLIVGAGLSGIGAAVHFKARGRGHRFAVLEGRADLGGTWDLFRYPGVRSDSDMYTLAFSFRPWTDPRAIVDGASVLRYLKETAKEHGLYEAIRFGHRVRSASWSSADARWIVSVECSETREVVRLSCGFLYMCTGYYDYAKGYCPDFAGLERFPGPVVHPQHWPSDLDCAGKRVAVIGSGATAVSLVPALAESAAHVTLLQRSPSYLLALPARNALLAALGTALGTRVAAAAARWGNIAVGQLLFQLCRAIPSWPRKLIMTMARRALGPDGEVEVHFSPSYQPWEQRLCIAPDGDLFEAIRSGRASVLTDRIETFTESGLSLESGTQLPVDVVVTATGLELQLMSNLEIVVDGVPVDASRSTSYRGMMFSDIPNLASAFGYINASWTLGSELKSSLVCRLLDYMAGRGYRRCVPRLSREIGERQPFVDFSSGYVKRGMHRFPGQGSRAPWRVSQNYLRDRLGSRWISFTDGSLEFS